MLKRILSAIVFVPLILGFVFLGGAYTALLVALVSLLALRECGIIGSRLGIRQWPWSTCFFSLTWLFLIWFELFEMLLPAILAWLLFVMSKMALQYPKVQFNEVGYNLFAPLYTVVAFSHLYLIRSLENGLIWSLLAIILVWATDTFALLVGRSFGKRPLAPLVSPKKTLEGSLGGLFFCVLTALLAWLYFGGVSWTVYLSMGLVVGIIAQIGDLFESALKRSANVKDSSNLIPGHGGILDRFDSLLFVAPLVYYALIISGVTR